MCYLITNIFLINPQTINVVLEFWRLVPASELITKYIKKMYQT